MYILFTITIFYFRPGYIIKRRFYACFNLVNNEAVLLSWEGSSQILPSPFPPLSQLQKLFFLFPA